MVDKTEHKQIGRLVVTIYTCSECKQPNYAEWWKRFNACPCCNAK